MNKRKPKSVYNIFRIVMTGERFTPQSIAHQVKITDYNARKIIKQMVNHNIVKNECKIGQTNYYRWIV